MRTILFMPSWYPTKEYPLSGSFFKEQAECLASSYNIILLHYSKTHFSFIGLIGLCYHLFKNRAFIDLIQEDGFISIKCRILLLGSQKIFNLGNRLIIKYFNHRIRSILKRNNLKIDVLYAVTAQINSIDAMNVANCLNVPYVVAEHCPFPLPQTAISNETKYAIENADCVISISRDKTRQMLIQGLNIHPVFVGNMVDEDIFTLSEEKKHKDFTILIVAANNFYKDYTTFFKTMKHLKKICTIPFKILIVGFSPVEKSIWNEGEDEFKKLVENYDLLDICELIPKASRAEMPNYYHRADVFVMTSIQEGFPVSSLEATSCGLPVYATRCGGVEDFIDDENGRIVNIQDFETMADHLKDLLERHVSYDANLIRKKTVDQYGKEAFLNKMAAIFNRTIEEYNTKKEK